MMKDEQIDILRFELNAARIMAGALFEKYANKHENDKAAVFDIIKTSLERYVVYCQQLLTEGVQQDEWTLVTEDVCIDMLEDHYYYLAAIIGFKTPKKVKFHKDIMFFEWLQIDDNGKAIRSGAYVAEDKVKFIKEFESMPLF